MTCQLSLHFLLHATVSLSIHWVYGARVETSGVGPSVLFVYPVSHDSDGSITFSKVTVPCHVFVSNDFLRIYRC